MYLTNKYTLWYKSIIAKARQRVNHDGYFEKHHILPKSLGGSNDSSNLVRLTAKEHFICHLLLVKMTEGVARTKMRYAAWMMVKNNTHQNRVRINSKQFQLLREQLVMANKERPGPNLGNPMTAETKQKLSTALKGKAKPERTIEHSSKLGQYIRTADHRQAISTARKSQTGLQTRSDETKSKMSAWQKGIAKPTLTCEHCNKTISNLNYKRWHGANCKHQVNTL
jgi:hypothetical protein